MKSKNCKGCRCYWPKGSSAFSYDVCNYHFLSLSIQTLTECPNGKPIYGRFYEEIPSGDATRTSEGIEEDITLKATNNAKKEEG